MSNLYSDFSKMLNSKEGKNSDGSGINSHNTALNPVSNTLKTSLFSQLQGSNTRLFNSGNIMINSNDYGDDEPSSSPVIQNVSSSLTSLNNIFTKIVS